MDRKIHYECFIEFGHRETVKDRMSRYGRTHWVHDKWDWKKVSSNEKRFINIINGKIEEGSQFLFTEKFITVKEANNCVKLVHKDAYDIRIPSTEYNVNIVMKILRK